MVRLLRGVGTGYWPRVPLVDAELAAGLARRGWLGARSKDSAFATPREEVAQEYAGEDGVVYEVVPLDGSAVGWARGISDMVLDFEGWLRRALYSDVGVRNSGAFIRDVIGDSSIVETYLSLGRQKKMIAALVDTYLRDITITEVRCGPGGFDASSLEGHSGEVWVRGPYDLRPVSMGREIRP